MRILVVDDERVLGLGEMVEKMVIPEGVLPAVGLDGLDRQRHDGGIVAEGFGAIPDGRIPDEPFGVNDALLHLFCRESHRRLRAARLIICGSGTGPIIWRGSGFAPQR